jgi:hypothetical protein
MMLQVSFGQRWLTAAEAGWVRTYALYGGRLYVWLDFHRLAADRRTVSITRARWRYGEQEFVTARASVGAGQRAMLVVARQVMY